MVRAVPNRILREGILTSEAVAKLGWSAEVFYRRLMSVADDYGRFYALPKLVRSACYPLLIDKVSDADIGKWISECETAGLVSVYPASDGKRYLQIEKFGQQVRAKSKFPQPLLAIDINRDQTIADAHLDGDVGEDVGEDDLEPIGSGASPAGEAPQNRSEAIPYQAIVDGYNGNLERLPKVRELTSKRRTALRNAWQANAQRRSLEFWNAYWEECADDPFLNGIGPYKNGHENWRPNFDYLIRGDVVTRVFEKAMDRLEKRA